MILQSLSLRHFKQYANLNLEFQEGLIGIVGKNGAGKSSLFEAILLCLFGSSSTEKAFYKTSWAGKKDNILLELQFELNQNNYLIRREFRGKALTPQASLFDHKGKLIAQGASAVNTEVSKLLGMDKEAFTRSVFSGQKELGIISGTRGEERKKMVRKMIGLDNLDQIQKIIREDRKDIERSIKIQEENLLSPSELKIVRTEAKQENKNLELALNHLKKSEKQLNKNEENYLGAKNFFDEQFAKQKEFSHLNEELIKMQGHLESLIHSKEENELEFARLKELEKQLEIDLPSVTAFLDKKKIKEKLDTEKLKYDKAFSTKNEKIRFQKAIEEIREQKFLLKEQISRQENIGKVKENIGLLIKKNADLLQTYEEQLNNLHNAEGAIAGQIKDRQKTRQIIQDLGQDAHCPTCLQPLIDVYEDTLTKLSREITNYESYEMKELGKKRKALEKIVKKEHHKRAELQEKFMELNAQFELLEEKKKELSQLKERYKKGNLEIDKLENELNALGKIEFDPESYQLLQIELNEFEKRFLQYEIRKNEVTKLPSISSEISKLKDRIKKGQEWVKNQNGIIKKLKFSVNTFEKAKKHQDEAITAKEEAQRKLNAQKEIKQGLEQKIINIKRQIEANQKVKASIVKQQGQFHQLDELVELFGAFKTYILERVRPTISGEASQLFEQITRGRYEGIEVDDNFEFHIYENGIPYPISRFSGGEIDLANLCLRIGISKAIAELSGSNNPLSFLGFDEIFGSQDDDRRFEILHALAHLKEKYRQIYIISHVDSVNEHFPKRLHVRKTPFGSTSEWV